MTLDMYIMTCIQHYSKNSDFFFKQLSSVINSSFRNPLSASYYLLVLQRIRGLTIGIY